MLALKGKTRRLDDPEICATRLDFNDMKRHGFLHRDCNWDEMYYQVQFFSNGERYVRLPAPFLFDNVARQGWRFSEEEMDTILEEEARNRPQPQVDSAESSATGGGISVYHYGAAPSQEDAAGWSGWYPRH